MWLKRVYDSDKNVVGVRVLRAGKKQHFSPDFVTRACGQGWLSYQNGQIILRGEAGLLVYNVLRTPGNYDGEVINYYDCVRVE